MLGGNKPIALGLLAAVAMVGCGEGGGSSTTSGKSACAEVPPAKPRSDRTSESKPTTILGPGTWTATVKTNCGSFTILLDSEASPKTSSSFASLAEKGFYDELSFHRVVPGFVIQGGDPLGTGLGGPGYTTVERPPAEATYPRGTVAMAKSPDQPPGAAGSQFFVVTGEEAALNPEYALLGRVTSGLDVVDRISSIGVDSSQQSGAMGSDGPPAKPVVIESVKVERKA